MLARVGAGALAEVIDVLLAKRAEDVEHARRRNPATVINVRVADGEKALTAVVVATDATVAQRAVASLKEAMVTHLDGGAASNASAVVARWDGESGAWLPAAEPCTSVRSATTQ